MLKQRIDDRLSLIDQALFLAMRGTGQEPVMQCVWIYEHPVDFEAVRKFHENFGYGLLGRLIEPSPLPFGRHRWVSALGPPADLDAEVAKRPRSELSDWIDEQVRLPIDPELGPGWRLGMLPLTDGSTAISLVASHCVVDGIGGLLRVADTVNGRSPDLGFPQARSRPKWRTALSDARASVAALPQVMRSLVSTAKLAYRHRNQHAVSGKRPQAAPWVEDGSGDVPVPAVAVFVDIPQWDERAQALGGSSYSLLAGFAAKLAVKLGRVNEDDGSVALYIPVNDRLTEEDTRANAAVIAKTTVDPAVAQRDLSVARAAIKTALATAREVPDEMLQLLPLIPFIPTWAVKRTADFVLSAGDLPVSCSNLGDLPSDIARIDGTEAEFVIVRGVDRHVPRSILERRGGLLTLVSGRISGKVSTTVVAYQPGAENTKARLRELVTETLAEFGLRGLVD